MPKDKKPYIELHDAHVTAALDDRSEQHFRWMMEQDRPELSTEDQEWCDKLEDSWKDEWEKVDRDWEQLVRGAAGASDIVEYQRRVEELEARREEILADRRKLFETQAAVQKKLKKVKKSTLTKYPQESRPQSTYPRLDIHKTAQYKRLQDK